MKKLLLSLVLFLPILLQAEEARLLRFPSVGGDKIAFTYSGDLYTVSLNGGIAQKITSDIGFEMFSRFSPDGKTIAFTAQYDGNTEVYSIPSNGGVPKRLTYSANVERDDVGERMGPNNIVMCWTPDGKEIVFRSKWHNFSGLRGALYKVSLNGGDVKRIPTTEGGFCSYSPDEKFLAMNRMFREFRTWKYYAGGQADDIWINEVGTTKLENITNNPAQDIFPMWIRDEIFFLSDRDHIMNLFCYNTVTKKISKVTDFMEYDCKFPSYSKDYIVFENGGFIYKYTVKDKKCEKVKIELKDENLYARTKIQNYSDSRTGRYGSYSLSPNGERVLTTFRGDIFSLPATKGATYNLSRSSSSHEREAIWSPDGKQIAFLSDNSGEYQLYVMPYDASSEPIQLTKFKDGYPQNLSWSPDSKNLYFVTEKMEFYSVDVANKGVKKIFQGVFGGIGGYNISKDGKWIAYSTTAQNRVSVIYIYDVEGGKHYQVTDKWFDSYSPLFSEDGKYLFFSSAREFQARYSRVEWNTSYDVSNYLFVIPLAKETPNPTLIKGDEYLIADESDDKANNDKGDKKEDTAKVEKTKKSTKIDFDGIIERGVALPLPAGRYGLITTISDDLYFSESGEIKKISMKSMEVSSVSKSSLVTLTSDNKKGLVLDKGSLYVVSIPSFKTDKSVPMEDISVVIDYSSEWRQIFNESWRITRDYFYVKNMHGKNWEKVRDKYAILLPYVKHRQDLTYIIGEMIAELNVGHAYITTGEAPQVNKIKTGLLGGDFSKDGSGYFKIEKIYQGVTWGTAKRSPLKEAEGVSVGNYIIEIDCVPAKEYSNIYQALIGKAGKTVALKVNSSPSATGAKTIYVKPIDDESQLAYYEWVQNNIKKVEEASGGEIGYIHIPDMGLAGLDEFTKLFYTQLDKKALIIDDRMNGGGNVSPMILERLSRVVYRMSMQRNGPNLPIPNDTHYGPKVCLVDKYSSSDGDLFPYGFQQLKLGKVIGTRTWGGIVGISGSKPYVDGQDMRTPFFTSFSTDGKWVVENHGIDPDIVIDINPFEDYLGRDAQLDKAIEVLKEELKHYKPLPTTPPDRVAP